MFHYTKVVPRNKIKREKNETKIYWKSLVLYGTSLIE